MWRSVLAIKLDNRTTSVIRFSGLAQFPDPARDGCVLLLGPVAGPDVFKLT